MRKHASSHITAVQDTASKKNTANHSFFSTKHGVIITASICSLLWGSAFPMIKLCYSLFSVGAQDVASQLLLAGIRFSLAGFVAWLLFSAEQRKPLIPKKSSWRAVVILALILTVLQYSLFYVGLAHTSGMTGSIIVGSGTFFAILFAALLFHQEELTAPKLLGCSLGFAGVLAANLAGASATNPAAGANPMLGNALVLASTISTALATCLMKRYTAHENPVCLNCWQFMIGGLILCGIGLAGQGKLTLSPENLLIAILCLGYMVFISSVAYSLRACLLAHNPVSRVSIFDFMTPVAGVILSAVFLGEGKGASAAIIFAALALVSAGIVVVNKAKA